MKKTFLYRITGTIYWTGKGNNARTYDEYRAVDLVFPCWPPEEVAEAAISLGWGSVERVVLTEVKKIGEVVVQ